MPLVYLLVAALAIAVAVFALQNADRVTVSFLAWKIEGAPLAGVILVSLAVGGLLVSLVGLVQRWKLRAQIRQLEARLRTPEPPRPVT
ncbi:MAG: LapA family protein [Candidatus Rokubacteria bacterium]|nr:LapA family protein [Candidatus Rokubacteria bacterium]